MSTSSWFFLVMYLPLSNQDMADKDDLIGTRTIPLTSIVKKNREQRIDLKDKAGKLVKGKDGQTTAIFLRLAGTRAQKSGSILDVPGDTSF